MDRVVDDAALDAARRGLGKEAVTRLVRRVVAEARREALAGGRVPSRAEVVERVSSLARVALGARTRPVINATGVVLHTNLGRAPLAPSAAAALASSAGRYASLEIDLESGRRGGRGAFAERALVELTGAEAALLVNNNAAATLLALTVVAAGKRVLVSRGELVEIGGGFRVPDVCARSGAALVEVGTTNRTKLADYASALAAGGVAAILRVHPANFRMEGFVERARLAPLVEVAHAHGAIVVEDLGSGSLVDLAPHGLVGEPTVGSSIAAGADLVCFSTDKLLGGPQGGAIVGRASLVGQARRDPLARAVRMGRLPLVAIEATLALYLEGRTDEVPALHALRRPLDEVRREARALEQALAAQGVLVAPVELDGAAGGGTLAEQRLPSAGIALEGHAEVLAARLRAGDPPVLARIHEGRLLFDARTLLPGEAAELVRAIAAAIAVGVTGA